MQLIMFLWLFVGFGHAFYIIGYTTIIDDISKWVYENFLKLNMFWFIVLATTLNILYFVYCIVVWPVLVGKMLFKLVITFIK